MLTLKTCKYDILNDPSGAYDELMDKGTALVNNLRNEKEGNKKEGNKKDVYKAFADYYSWTDGVIKEQYEKGVLKVKK